VSAGSAAVGFINGKKGRIIRFSITQNNAENISSVSQGLYTNKNNNNIYLKYEWLNNETYKTLITVIKDSLTATTFYTGYVFLNKENAWKLLGSFKVKNDISVKSANQVTLAANSKSQFKALSSGIIESWVQRENGSWKELTEATFHSKIIADMRVEKAGALIFGGSNGNTFTLDGSPFNRTPTNQRPNIDVTKHVDSAEQYSIDMKLMAKAVADKKIDTTASVNGVYYKILKEGTGAFVNVSDTVTCYYKGSLLSDGSQFDATKENKPATFPLKR
jgi:hypothetical protein